MSDKPHQSGNWFSLPESADQPITFYHGCATPEGLTEFIPGGIAGSRQSGDMYGMACYFTTDPEHASLFAKEAGAVFPVRVRGELLVVEGDLTPEQSIRVSGLANRLMLPSDRARFEAGRPKRYFDNEKDAEAFFREQLDIWRECGDRMDRARPDVDFLADGRIEVTYTEYQAQLRITSGEDAFTLFRAIGFDNLPAAGFDGMIMRRESGALWAVMHRPLGNVEFALSHPLPDLSREERIAADPIASKVHALLHPEPLRVARNTP